MKKMTDGRRVRVRQGCGVVPKDSGPAPDSIEQIEIENAAGWERIRLRSLKMMTLRLEWRVDRLRKQLLTHQQEQGSLDEQTIAKFVRQWWHKLEPEERRILARYWSTMFPQLEAALHRCGRKSTSDKWGPYCERRAAGLE